MNEQEKQWRPEHDELEGDREHETESAAQLGPLRSGRSTILRICIVMALVGASAFLWLQYGDAPKALMGLKSEPGPPVVSLEAFDKYRQEVAGNLQREDELLQAHEAELKRLSEQLMQLVTKLDLLEHKAPDAQAAIPLAPKAVPRKPATKPAPRVSTGGAPLPPAPGSSEAQAPPDAPR